MKGENFFDRLLQMPLFQGIGRNDFWEIAERIRIGFHRKSAGTPLVKCNDSCDALHFVMKGRLRVESVSEDYSYSLQEWVDAPLVIQPECMFGPTTRYTRTFVADEEVHYFLISKGDVRDMLFNYPTFRINWLNLLTRQVQMQNHRLWRKRPEELDKRFLQFLLFRTMRPAGKKVLHIKMEQLAEEMLTTRLNVSQMLRQLQEQGHLSYSRGKIEIPQFEKLIM